MEMATGCDDTSNPFRIDPHITGQKKVMVRITKDNTGGAVEVAKEVSDTERRLRWSKTIS